MEGTQSIERAIQLLRLFDDERPTWTLQQLIYATGLKKTTVFRMLTALKNEGFLMHQQSTGSWQLGSELIMFGGRAMRQNRFREVARDFMHRVSRLTGESVTLDILWLDDEMIPYSMVIDESIGRHLLGLTQYVGTRLPAHATSTGKVLLAFQPEITMAEINLTDPAPLTDDTLNSKAEILAELETIRTAGYGTTMHELEVGIAGIAGPILDVNGEVLAAISVAGPTSRLTSEQLLSYAPILLDAANDISAQIGYRATPSQTK